MSKGKYKIMLDNGNDLTLYEKIIINNVLLTGKEIDKELEQKIIEDNYKVTPYYQALQYINVRMRSREEIENYLLKKGHDEALVNKTLEHLEKEGYINDKAFAMAYTSDKLNLSNDGINKIKKALNNYNISTEIIDQTLSKVDNQEISDRLDKLIAKQLKVKTKYTGNMLKNKILNHLVNLGYDSNKVLEKLNCYNFKGKGNINKDYQQLYKKYTKKYSGYKLDMTIKQHLYQKGYDSSDIEAIIK